MEQYHIFLCEFVTFSKIIQNLTLDIYDKYSQSTVVLFRPSYNHIYPYLIHMNENPDPISNKIPQGSLRERINSLLRYQGVELIRLTTFVILFVMLLLFILENRVDLSRWRFYGTIACLALILIINIVWDRIVQKVPNQDMGHFGLILMSGALMLLTAWLGHYITIIYLFFMIAAQVFIIFGFSKAFWIVVGLTIAYMLEIWLLGINLEGMFSLGSGLLVGLVFIGTLSRVLSGYAEQTRKAERLTEQLRQANADLLTARQREAELAVSEERVRIARDIHDGLGHHLTVLNIQLQAIAKIINLDTQQAAAMVDTSREEARAALEEVRRSVAFMRQTPLDGTNLEKMLVSLVDTFNHSSTDLKAILEIDHSPENLPLLISVTLYRVAQEGLTNAHKHARGATQVMIHLEFNPKSAKISVVDNGEKPTLEQKNEYAFGLAGMRERIEQQKGTFTAGPLEERGFLVQAEIPITEQHHD
jgi:signal transduction histidine kinase